MRINGKDLAYDRESETYATEASCLGLRPGQAPSQTINVVNPGMQDQAFYFTGVDRNGEGELAGWRYRGVLPQSGRLLIIND